MFYLRLPATFALGLVLAFFLWPQRSHASCGVTFCSVNTQWETQGAWTDPGLRLNLRYEYANQDQLRRGSDKVAPAGVFDTHDEIRTLNRNLLLDADYALNPDWAFSAHVPVVQRNHRHVHNEIPTERESWNFMGLGDVRISGRYQKPLSETASAGVQFGLKLPTGKFDEINAEGQVAERSLQPGSGTTDLLLGAYSNHRLRGDNATIFLQGMWLRPLSERSDYQPGQQVTLDIGARYALSQKLNAHLQLNLLWKDQDQGLDAERDDSGGHSLFISPGASYALNRRWQLYGFVQLPIYQYVNGIQLTADWSALAGFSWKL